MLKTTLQTKKTPYFCKGVLAEVETGKKERGYDMNQGVLFQVNYKGDVWDVYGFVGSAGGFDRAFFIACDPISNYFTALPVVKCTRI